MNRVYKVIWSKAKHCYVVTSEIAKGHTKGETTGKGLKKLAAAMLVAAALLSPSFAWAEDTAVKVDTSTSVGAVEVYTKKGTDTALNGKADKATTLEGYGITDAYTKTETDNALSGKADKAANLAGYGITDAYTKTETDNALSGKADKAANLAGYGITDAYTKTETDNALSGKADKATTLEGYGITDAYTKTDVDGKIAAEENARKAADKDNLKVDDHGVIKVTEDGTTSSDVDKLVLNKDGTNWITMDGNGIKVGKNSTTMDEKGFYAGSDYDYGTAKAALDATEGKIRGANGAFEVNKDGEIKGAAGKFTVDKNGLVTANGGIDTNGGAILTRNGNINAGSGDISGKDISASGNLRADGDIHGKDITGSGTLTGHALTDGTARMEGGALTGVTTITATGNISTGGDVVSTGGKVQGTSISDGTATLSGGSLTDAVNIDASGTITGNNVVVKDKLTTKDLEVTGVLNTDHITLGSETNNYTDIDKGKVTSKVDEIDGAVKYTAESFFNRDGSSITARTDEGAVDSTGISKVGATEISQYLGDNAKPESSQKNVTRKMVRNDDGTFRLEDKVVDKDGNKSSIVSQNAGERKVELKEGTKTLTVTENLTAGIVSETNDGAGKTVTLTQGMDGTYKVETSGTSTEVIGGQKIENYKDGLDTNITGNEFHHVTQNQTNTVDGTLTETVTGKVTENYKDNLETTVEKNEVHHVKGNQENTVDGTLTETVKENVTEDYKKDLSTTVGGNQTTTVTGDSSLSAKNISNTAENGIITNTAQEVITKTGKNTVTSNTDGTTFTNEDAKAVWTNDGESGTRTDTKVIGNKVETGKVLTDFAEVANNLDVKGSTTLGRDENTTLTVKSKSTFKDTVKMEKTLEVDGESTFNNKVTITKGGLDVTGGTTTDELTVTGDSEFVGRADFRDNVFMDKDLKVTGETRTGTLYVNKDGYVDGNLYVEGNIETHDAELSENSRQVVTGRQLYQTNERVDRLDNRIKKVGANAAALAALRPGDFNPDDKFSIAAGFGSYRNASAAALGLFYRPNENVILSLGTSFGDGENMVNAGVSVKFGRGKSMAERRKEMAEEVSVMRDEMKNQNDRIAELEEMLKKQSELIEKLSKES